MVDATYYPLVSGAGRASLPSPSSIWLAENWAASVLSLWVSYNDVGEPDCVMTGSAANSGSRDDREFEYPDS